MRLLAAIGLGLAALSSAAVADSGEYDLKWIGSLPGVTGTVRKATAGSHKAVYSVSADVEETLNRVRDGLARRGWTVDAPKGVSVAGAAVRSVEAQKGPAHVKVLATGATGAVNLDVNAEGVPGGGEPAAEKPTRGRTGGGAVVATHGDINIMHGSVRKTYRCDGSNVSIVGGDCHITLEGNCGSLSITGGDNVVRVEGTIAGPINVTGAGNQVSWSGAKNPQPPEVNQVGANNQIGPKD